MPWSACSRGSTASAPPQICWRVSLLLTIIPGVKSFDVSLENQTAQIVTEDSLDYDTVLEKIKKTGKTVNSGEADGNPRDV